MKRNRSASSTPVKPAQLKAQGAPPQVGIGQPYTVEYYYKVQWGHQEEFLQLFLKNHYPVLEKLPGDGADSRAEDRDAGVPHDGGRAMGLSGDDPLQGLDGGDDGEPRRREIQERAMAGPGDVCARGAAEI